MQVPVFEKVGIDANRPIDPESGAIAAQVADPAIIAGTGVGWVRLNFVLGRRWSSVTDPGWIDTYRRIVQGFVRRGIKIYGLISDEAMPAPPGDQFRDPPPAGNVQDDWINRYADAFVAIVRQFHNDVALFESYNEPDDFHRGNRNWIHPGWFAIMLQTIHDRVRADAQIRHVRLVSGPVQGLHNADDNHNNNGGAKYLRATYAAGKERFGWGSSIPFPFDGVGYHPYVAQAPHHTDAQIRQKYHEYMNELRQIMTEEEGALKPIYLSEYGWFSNHNNDEFQQRAMRVGMELALEDDSLALVIWFCTQDFGPEQILKFYGLYRIGSVDTGNRKPVYEIFRSICQQSRQVTVAGEAATVQTVPPFPQVRMPRIFTNQQVLNAISFAANRLGLDQWDLLERSGQSVESLAQDRGAIYAGPPFEGVSAFSSTERSVLLQELLGQMLQGVKWVGNVTATLGLNLRGGPGADQERIGMIGHGELVQVLHEQDGWLFVVWQGTPGYVSAAFVENRTAPTTTPAVVKRPPTLQEIWQRFSAILHAESARLGIDPAVAMAVLLAESGGRTAADDGRMIIRFENHIFFQKWGASNPELFGRFFQFDPKEKWKGHRWRRSPNAPWQECHQSQAGEWEILEFARSMHEESALQSISMGAAQIMGFNFAVVGYRSASEMFKDFQRGEENQIRGFFRFIEAKGLVDAVRNGNYLAFAEGYNGAGQAPLYRDIILRYLERIRQEVRVDAEFPISREIAPLPEEAAPRLPFPIPVQEGKTLAEVDLALYEAWREHIQQGFKNNQTMFDQVLRGFMNPYWTTVWMNRILFAVGILLFVMAGVLAYLTQENPVTAIGATVLFGGLGAGAFLAYFVSRPLQALEENLQFITWLGIVYNSYWTRLAYISNLDTVQAEVEDVTDDTILRLQELLDKHAEISSKRATPGG
jgi:hypothetical protein